MAGTLRLFGALLIISIGLCCTVAVVATDDADQALANCHQEVEAIAKCLGDHHEEPPKNDSMKQEFEQCFTNAGCDAPKPPTEGGHPPEGHPKGGPGEKSSGSGGMSEGGLDEAKCFMAVQKNVSGLFVQCLQQKGVNVTADGAKGGGKGHGAYQPPHGGPFDHHGPQSPHEHAQEFLANQCHNDTQKAQQVNSCLAQLHERKARSMYDAMCAAENTCKQQHSLSETCKAKLQNFAQALCECKQQLRPQVEQAVQSAKACKNQQPPPDSSHENCSDELKSPCEQGFDAFYAKHSKYQG